MIVSILLVLNLLIGAGSQNTDSLDLIYDNFYQNQSSKKEEITIINDKDFYFPGESIFFHLKVSSPDGTKEVSSKWAQVYLFDGNKKVVNHVRVFLNNGLSQNSILIPDSIDTQFLYLSLFTANTWSNTVKKIYLITNDAIDFSEWDSLNDNPRVDSRIDKEIKSEHFEAKLINNQIEVNFPNPEINVEDNIIMVCAKDQILWLSELGLNNDHINFEVSFVEDEISFVFCFLLNKNMQMIARKIIEVKHEKEVIDLVYEKGKIIFNVSDQFSGRPYLVKVIDSNFLMNRLTFSLNEYKELAQYGNLRSDISFSTAKEKTDWLNTQFDINLDKFIKINSSDFPALNDSIIYSLSEDVICNEKLNISAVDFRGKIIDHKLIGKKIFIDPAEFESEESLLLIDAKHKKRNLKLLKDTTFIKEKIESYLEKAFNRNFLNGNFFSNFKKNYLFASKSLNDIQVLEAVVVSDKKFRIIYPGRGTTKTYQELTFNNNENTAFDLLRQMNVAGLPHEINGNLLSNKRFFETNAGSGYYGYQLHYPMFLIVPGYYSGYDFRVLYRYSADWVMSITKADKQPEHVIVNIKPGFKEKDSYLIYDKIFNESVNVHSSGILHFSYNANNELNQVEVPIGQATNDISWYISFFNDDGSMTEFNGEIRRTEID